MAAASPGPLVQPQPGLGTNGHVATVPASLKRPVRLLILLAAMSFGAWWLSDRLPSSFLPAEDQGVLMAMVTLSEGATTAQTQNIVAEVEDFLLNEETETVEAAFSATAQADLPWLISGLTSGASG